MCINFMYKLVTWGHGQVILVNETKGLRSYSIFDNGKTKLCISIWHNWQRAMDFCIILCFLSYLLLIHISKSICWIYTRTTAFELEIRNYFSDFIYLNIQINTDIFHFEKKSFCVFYLNSLIEKKHYAHY